MKDEGCKKNKKSHSVASNSYQLIQLFIIVYFFLFPYKLLSNNPGGTGTLKKISLITIKFVVPKTDSM